MRGNGYRLGEIAFPDGVCRPAELRQRPQDLPRRHARKQAPQHDDGRGRQEQHDADDGRNEVWWRPHTLRPLLRHRVQPALSEDFEAMTRLINEKEASFVPYLRRPAMSHMTGNLIPQEMRILSLRHIEHLPALHDGRGHAEFLEASAVLHHGFGRTREFLFPCLMLSLHAQVARDVLDRQCRSFLRPDDGERAERVPAGPLEQQQDCAPQHEQDNSR